MWPAAALEKKSARLLRATLGTREERPRRVAAEERLRQRSSASPRSPLATQAALAAAVEARAATPTATTDGAAARAGAGAGVEAEVEADAEVEVEVEVEGMDVSESGGEEVETAAERSLDLDGARSPDALSNDFGDSDGDQPGPSIAPSQELLAVDQLRFEVCHVDMVGKQGGIAQSKLQQLQQLLQGRFCKKNPAFNGVNY